MRRLVMRALFVLTLCASLLFALFIWQHRLLTVKIANYFMAPYSSQFQQLHLKPHSLVHWSVPLIKLNIQGHDIQIQNAQLKLVDTLTLESIFSPSIEHFHHISIDNITITIDPSVLNPSLSHAPNGQEPNLTNQFLDLLEQLPVIDINSAIILLATEQSLVTSPPSISPAPLRLTLDNLSLNSEQQFSSTLYHNEKKVTDIKAKIDNKTIVLSTSLSLTKLQNFVHHSQAIITHEARHIAAQVDTNKQSSPISALKQLFTQLKYVDTTLKGFDIKLGGELESNVEINLANNQFISTHIWKKPRLTGQISFPFIVSEIGTQAANSNRLALSLSQAPQFTVKQLGDELNFSLQPLTLNLSASAQNIKQLVINNSKSQAANVTNNSQVTQTQTSKDKSTGLGDDIAFLYNNLVGNNAIDKISANGQQANLSLNFELASILSYGFNQSILTIPELNISLGGSKIEAALALKHCVYSIGNQVKEDNKPYFNSDWALSMSHKANIDINSLWPTLTHLPYRIAIKGSHLNLFGTFIYQATASAPIIEIEASQAAPQFTNSILIEPINHSKQTSKNAALINGSKMHVHQAQLSMLDKFEFKHSKQGVSQFTFPALNYSINQLDIEQSRRSDSKKVKQKKPNTVLSTLTRMTGIEAELSKPISLILQANMRENITAQILSQKQKNQFSLSIAKVSTQSGSTADRQGRSGKQKKRLHKSSPLVLQDIDLKQQIILSDRQINTKERWSINSLDFTSSHNLKPTTDSLKYFTLTGQTNLKAQVDDLLPLIKQSIALPESLTLQGSARLDSRYKLTASALKKSHRPNYQFNLSLSPQLIGLNGNINELPFKNVELNTKCEFQWRQGNALSEEGNLTCEDLAFSAAAFNPGVLISNITANARLTLGTAVTPQKNATEDHTQTTASLSLTAKGDLLEGQLIIPNFQYHLNQASQAFFILHDISLTEVLKLHPLVGVQADGTFDGVLPVYFENGAASITGGKLSSRPPGGHISVKNNPTVESLRLSQPYLDFAFTALEDLTYHEILSHFDMLATGDAILKINVRGKTQGVTRPIHLNYTQEENMIQLLKSLQIGNDLQNQIEKKFQSK